jgi:hypothetical protein
MLYLQAHKQFVETVGTGYLLALVMKLFDMEQLSDKPTHPDIPDNIKVTHTKTKETVFQSVMEHLIDATFIPPLQKEVTTVSFWNAYTMDQLQYTIIHWCIYMYSVRR